MSDYLFEFSLKAQVNLADIIRFLSISLELDSDEIVDTNTYWDDSLVGLSKTMGITINASSSGFKTTACGYAKFPLIDEILGELARKAAVYFDTEVTIGDYRYLEPDMQNRFILYFPDGRIADAVDNSHDGVNDVALLPCPASV